jgi:hypothetical protein
MDSVGAAAHQAIFHSPPLLFHLEYDPSEAHPLDAASAEYATARARIEGAAAAHRASVTPVPNQQGLGQDSKLKVCCDWSSKSKYPNLPTCTCNASNFKAWVCEPVADSELHALPYSGDARSVAVHPEGAGVARPFDTLDESTWPYRPLQIHLAA